MRKYLDCPASRFQSWWTIVCAVGAVAVTYLHPFQSGKASAAYELTLRVVTTRRLELARAFDESSSMERSLLGVRTLKSAIYLSGQEYNTRWRDLSLRGQVEYGILLAESGRTDAAQRVFSSITATNDRSLKRSQYEVVESTERWVRSNPQLQQFAPSNGPEWIQAAQALEDIYAGSGTTNAIAIHLPRQLFVLPPSWYLPALTMRTGAIDANAVPVSAVLQDRVILLAFLNWGILTVALVTLCVCGTALGRTTRKPYAFRYMGNWGPVAGTSVYARSVFYRYWWGMVAEFSYVATLPYWAARAMYHVAWVIFVPLYDMARLTPSIRLIRRGLGLDTELLKKSNVLVATAVLWLCKTGVSYVDGWILRRFPLGYRLTDMHRAELCLNPSIGSLAVMGFAVVLITPFGEEITYRGSLYPSLRRRWGTFLAAVATAGVFAAIHRYAWLGSIDIFLDGLLWAFAFEWTGSLWPGLIVHSLWNLLWFMNNCFLYHYAL
jgi:membrane protease YdiL (CAAX protease family)